MAGSTNDDSYMHMGMMEIPDGKDFPNISVMYDVARGEIVVYTHRMLGEITLTLVDGEGYNHTLKREDGSRHG